MKVYEKAIEKYKKDIREHYEAEIKEHIENYIDKVNELLKTGRCPLNMPCIHCPIQLVTDIIPCGICTASDRIMTLNQEV